MYGGDLAIAIDGNMSLDLHRLQRRPAVLEAARYPGWTATVMIEPAIGSAICRGLPGSATCREWQTTAAFGHFRSI
jgi:hypothetical protein